MIPVGVLAVVCVLIAVPATLWEYRQNRRFEDAAAARIRRVRREIERLDALSNGRREAKR